MSRMRLALVLGFGKGAATDSKRALQLFDETTRRSTTPSSNEALFAEVFAEFLKERLQSEAKISAVEVKIGVAEAKINFLNRQVDKEHERADELEKKLEALKSIEKSLHKR